VQCSAVQCSAGVHAAVPGVPRAGGGPGHHGGAPHRQAGGAGPAGGVRLTLHCSACQNLVHQHLVQGVKEKRGMSCLGLHGLLCSL
jgi:hypothetical protein